MRQPARGARASRKPRAAEVPPPYPEGASLITVADRVRKWGMVLLLGAFVGTAGLSLTAVLFLDSPAAERLLQACAEDDPDLALALADRPFDHLKQILLILLPAESALLGSVMGFYYGSQAKGAGG